MALIRCIECGKEISDKATACPNCGCPVQSPIPQNQMQPNQLPVKQKKKTGCLIPCLFIFLLFSMAVLFGISETLKNPDKYNTSRIANKYIDVTVEEGELIDSVLNRCGISKVVSFEHDALLDNAHTDGETGYRIAINNDVDNIILYLNADKSVYSLRYADNDLYADGIIVSTLNDYTLTSTEMSDWMIKCESKVKEILKSPSTAKFPNILSWSFSKEKNIITVQAYVDSQNSFSAEIRSQFTFVIDGNTNTIQSFVFDGQEMIN